VLRRENDAEGVGLAPEQSLKERLLFARAFAALIDRYASQRFFNVLTAPGPCGLSAFGTLHSLAHDDASEMSLMQ